MTWLNTILGLLLVGAAHPPAEYLNPAATPTLVCTRGWSASQRPPREVTDALKRQQLPSGADPRDYEEDHIVPLSLGGAPGLPNLRPQPWPEARRKDEEEIALHHMVCRGQISLSAAQDKIWSDW